MDVARISAVSPRQIDWRSLTAKQIIKYEQQGIDVPSQYLQWAQEFRASLDTNDETTYEMAVSKTPETTSTQTTELTTSDVNADSSTGESTSTSETEKPEEDKTAAQTKRQELQDSGVSLRNQAKIFTTDSKEASKAVEESSAIISAAQEQSTNEIASLESYMAELLSRAEAAQTELKNEVTSINEDRGDRSSFAKINELQKQLEQYGNSGQSEVSASESEFNRIDTTINAQSSSILNAADFGSETINVGNELLLSSRGFIWRILDYVIGRRAISAGSDAVSKSQTTETLQTEALSANAQNMSSAASYSGQVESKTGVAGTTPQNKSDNNDDNQALTEQQKEETKDVKTAQNDGTDDTDKKNTNIDEILKRKIRKGENIANA